MIDIKVSIHAKDRKIGAMVKALAFEVANKKAVKGASKEFLKKNGYLFFHFETEKKAQKFIDTVATYLPDLFASCEKL